MKGTLYLTDGMNLTSGEVRFVEHATVSKLLRHNPFRAMFSDMEFAEDIAADLDLSLPLEDGPIHLDENGTVFVPLLTARGEPVYMQVTAYGDYTLQMNEDDDEEPDYS